MVFTSMTLLIPAFALLVTPPVLAVWLLGDRTLPYHCLALSWGAKQSRASVRGLSLVTLSVPAHSTSELLRTLSMMAASKPTSWLFGRTDGL